MKKALYKNCCRFGNFYKKNWKVLVGAKLFLLVIAMTIVFSSRRNIGTNIMHGGLPAYAGGLCGDNVCASKDAYCQLSTSDCTKVGTGNCASITGCSIKTADVLSCTGTTFSCSNFSKDTSCKIAGCTRSGETIGGICTNDDGKGGQINETCSSLGSSACKEIGANSAGDCSRSVTSSTEICGGNITTPKNENECTTLKNTFLMYTIDIGTTRYPAYIEDETSCPADCSVQTCGNGQIEGTEICDDGNTMDGDGCNSTCTEKTTPACTGMETKSSCSTLLISAQCAASYSSLDKNQCKWDATKNNCGISAPCTPPSTQSCGNGIKELSEQCDDGNTTGGDGCSSSCKYEWTAGTAVSTATEQHIKTIINNSQGGAQLKAEFCLANLLRMEGNIGGSLQELQNIMMNNSYNANSFPYALYLATLDNIDYNNSANALNYFNVLLNMWGLPLATDQAMLRNQAQAYYNMFFWGPISVEGWAMTPLDDGTTYDHGIVAMCIPYYAFCGNGVLDIGEQCDDGNITNGDGCSSSCVLENQAPVATISFPVEGKTYDPTESFYSYGNGFDSDGTIVKYEWQINNRGRNENYTTGYYIPMNMSGKFTVYLRVTDDKGATGTTSVNFNITDIPSTVCGNGSVEGNEECDDGNTSDGDGCSSQCYTEPYCDISMTGATDESPFTAYFTYKIGGNTTAKFMQFDTDTTGDINDPDNLGTFQHIYPVADTTQDPTLYVSSKTHPELQASCSTATPICSIFTPEMCSSDALGDRGFKCADIPQSECLFLIELYKATDGPNWTNSGGWLDNPNACERYGITCTNNSVNTKSSAIVKSSKYLASIDLSNNNLGGKLPSTIDVLLPYVYGIFGITTSSDMTRKVSIKEVISTTPVKEVISTTPVKEVISTTPVKEVISTTPVKEVISTPTKEAKTISENIFKIFQSSKAISSEASQDTLLKRSLGDMVKFTPVGQKASSKIDLGTLKYQDIVPFLHLTTLNLSHNHIEGGIPQGYFMAFSFLETLNLSYNNLSSLFGTEELVSFPDIPGYDFLVQMMEKNGMGSITTTLQNISFSLPENVRPSLALNIATQRFALLPAAVFGIQQNTWEAFGVMGKFMGIISQKNKDNLNILREYYSKYFIPTPKYLGSLLDLFFGKSDEIKDGFIIDIVEAINKQTKIDINTIGEVLTDNKDFMDNVTPLTTSIVQRFTNVFTHLRVVDLSHNDISSIPTSLPINPCIESFDMSYNQLTKSLPFVQYFGYGIGPKIEIVDYLKSDTKVINASSNIFDQIAKGGLQILVAYATKTGEVMTGIQTGIINKGDEVVMTFTDYGSFESQITVPVVQQDPIDTIFGTNCTQESNGLITCPGKQCTPDDPKCIEQPSTQGQYIGIFTMGEDKSSHGSLCAYDSTAAKPTRTYDPTTMTFDAQNICKSLKMKPIYDINTSREVVGEPICERKTNTLSLNFSNNKFTGLLPNIVTTNSTTWQELNNMNVETGPLWTFMQSGTPIHVSVDVSNNNLTNDLQIPYITPTQSISQIDNNCLTFDNPTDDSQTKYMNNFLPGWNKQNVCDFPKISYSPTEKEGATNGKVTASVYLPKGCEVTNNAGNNTYAFDNNGAFAFIVNCRNFKNPLFMIAKVTWVDSKTTTFLNTKDAISNLDVYNENTKNENLTVNLPKDINGTKKTIAQESISKIKGIESSTNIVKTTKNINFVNDNKAYEKIQISTPEDLSSKYKISVEIPSDVLLYGVKNNKEIAYNKIFYAPVDKTDDSLLVNKFTSETKLIKPILFHMGSDETTTTVIAENENNEINDFTITIATDKSVGTKVDIFSSQDANTWIYFGTSTVVTGGVVTFTTPHLTYFGIGEISGVTPGTGTNTGNIVTPGGIIVGGGRSRLSMDYCPNGDASPSYYDNTCIGSTHTIAPVADATTTSQLLDAYKYAREHELITAASSDAKLYAKITRKELAKLISIYVKNVVGLVADPTRNCTFSDISKESTATRAYIKDVCKLGIMGVHQDGKTPLSLFKPDTFVTRAEVATVLSRVLFAGTYNTPLDSPYKRYTLHLAIFKNRKLIQNISQPDAIDTKGFVLILLQKIDKLVIKVVQ